MSNTRKPKERWSGRDVLKSLSNKEGQSKAMHPQVRKQELRYKQELKELDKGDTYTCPDCGGLYHGMFEICYKRSKEVNK